MRRTLIEDHPALPKLFGAPHPWRVAWTAVPLLATFIVLSAGLGWRTRLAAGAVGAVYWTFVEYALHRFFYHWRPRHPGMRAVVESFHIYHHRHMDDRAVWNAGPLLVMGLTVVLGAPVLLVTRDWGLCAAVLAGTAVAYDVYEWAHYLVHARRFTRGPLAYLQGFHLHHHHGDARRCFGVTNPVWDWLFGTAAPRRQWKTVRS